MALRSGKALTIVLIAIVLILVIAVGVGGYFLYSKGYFEQDANDKKTESSESEEKKETFKAKIENLVLNIPNTRGDEQLMKFSFALKSTNENIENAVDNNKEEILDATISIISARNAEELMTIGGKEILKEDLIDYINKILNESLDEDQDELKNSVTNIYFTDFVVK